MKTTMRIFAAAGIVALAACSAGGQSVVPLPGKTLAKTASVAFVMHWPTTTVQSRSKRRPQYISPSTMSVAVEVNGGSPQFFNKPTTSGSSTTSTLNITAPVGTDDFVFSLWDQPSGAGEELGQVEVSQAVAPGVTTTITATVDGVVARVAIAPAANQSFVRQGADATGNPTFAIVGDHAAVFTLTPLDADGNVIVPPGDAPKLALSSQNANLTIAPVSGNANEFTVQPSGPVQVGKATLQASATDDFGIVNDNYPLNEVAVTYVAWENAGTGSIVAYDDSQKPIALTGTFAGIKDPKALAYDADDHLLFVADAGVGKILAFDQNGNPASGFTAPSVAGITGIAYASNAKQIYATIGSTNAVEAFTPTGAAVTLSGGAFGGLQTPIGIAYDSANGDLFVANASSGANANEFDTTGAPAGAQQLFPATTNTAAGIAVDPTDNLAAITYNLAGSYGIATYDANYGYSYNFVSTNLNNPAGVAFNPIADEFYVANAGANDVIGFLPTPSTGNLTLDPTLTIVDPNGATKPSSVAVVY